MQCTVISVIKNEELQTKLEDSSRELNRVSLKLKSVNDTITGNKVKLVEKDHELAELKEVVEREKQKV